MLVREDSSFGNSCCLCMWLKYAIESADVSNHALNACPAHDQEVILHVLLIHAWLKMNAALSYHLVRPCFTFNLKLVLKCFAHNRITTPQSNNSIHKVIKL